MNDERIADFKSERFGQVRTVEVNGKTHFVAKDVAMALGYRNTKDAILRHCNGVVKRDLTDSLGRNQIASVIPEGDIYRLVTHSKLPTAQEFESWVFDEVLPTIRKTGGYISNASQMVETYFGNMDGVHKELVKGLLINIEAQQKQLTELQPKVQYHDDVLDSTSYMTLTEIAKSEGFPSAQQLNKLLEEHKVIYRVGYRGKISRKQPSEYPHAFTAAYKHFVTDGYAKISTLVIGTGNKRTTKHTIKWSEKGRKWLHEFINNI